MIYLIIIKNELALYIAYISINTHCQLYLLIYFSIGRNFNKELDLQRSLLIKRIMFGQWGVGRMKAEARGFNPTM